MRSETTPATNATNNSNGRPADAQPPEQAHRVAEGNGEHAIEMDLPKLSGTAVLMMGLAILLLFAGLFLLGWIPHNNKQKTAEKVANDLLNSKPIVDIVQPKKSDIANNLSLPGTLQAVQSTAIYARTNGYIKNLLVDIGDQVKAGQLLAEISTPEVDAELEQAKASLQQAQVVVGRATNEFNFNKSTFERFSGLAQTGGVTAQQLDERRSQFNIATSSLKAAQANVAAAEATVKRYSELQGFQKIIAPFDGTITARNYDLGALTSATGGGNNRELFQLDQIDTLRAYVNVPQTYVAAIKVGQEAELMVRNYPGKAFKGVVERSAGAIDQTTRTLRFEVRFENADKQLFSGMYGQIRFKLKPEQPPLTIPTSALVFGPSGLRIAVVEGNKSYFRKVTIGRDFGSEAEITEGLQGQEMVVTNPGERLADGGEVQIASKTSPDAPKPVAQAAAR